MMDYPGGSKVAEILLLKWIDRLYYKTVPELYALLDSPDLHVQNELANQIRYDAIADELSLRRVWGD